MAGRQSGKRQRGAALLIFMILVVTAALTYVVTSLTPEAIEARRAQKTNAALAQARAAVVWYAETFRERQNKIQIDAGGLPPNFVQGYLPLPDLGTNNNTNIGCTTEGCDANLSGSALHKTVVGRFPWALFGTGPLRDGHGECLWYIVSGGHQRVDKIPVMNWDTLGEIDIVTTNEFDSDSAKRQMLKSLLAGAHDRPVAIIFSAGPLLANQDRSANDGNIVTQCQGNYNPANYLEPGLAAALLNSDGSASTSVYFSGAVSTSNTDTANLAISTQGKIYQDGAATNLKKTCPAGTANCPIVANDVGLELSPGMLFDAIRKSGSFRNDINLMLDKMADCARDQIATGGFANSKVNDACSIGLDAFGPPGYYAHYRDQVFVAACPSCSVTQDNNPGPLPTCAGVLLFGNQRIAGQNRRNDSEKGIASNYLESPNLASFGPPAGDTYAGISRLLPLSQQSLGQDLVRCIPPGASLVAAPSALPTGSELSRYDSETRTITLGRLGVESDVGNPAYAGTALFGCIWTPEAHATGNGFRSYFNFTIDDSGDGFVFAAIDGDDPNGSYVCGAGEQHLGYSGNNGYTNPILFPKLGLEIDTRYNFQRNTAFVPDGFNPARRTTTAPIIFRTLANGRADPNYPSGDHIGLVYWGGESPINTRYSTTTACTASSDCLALPGSSCVSGFCTYNACNSNADCLSPATCDTTAHACVLKQEEDDNVHDQLPSLPATRPPPHNPKPPVTAIGVWPPTTAPANPPYPPYGVDKLDGSYDSPVGTTYHMRMEVQRAYAGRDDNSRLVKVVATTNLTLSGLTDVIDGVSLSAGDSVLVTGQTDAKTNGVYLAATGAWARAPYADENFELAPGTSWFIQSGAAHAGSLWRVQNTEVPILRVSTIDIQRFRAPVKSVATGNISKSGLSTVGGYAAQAGDRILLTGQSDARENGVWLASAGAWSRATPENTATGMRDGALWFVSNGSGAGTYWRLNGDANLEASSITIAQPGVNDLYAARITTQVWKALTTDTNDVTRMKITTSSMAEMDPVVRHGTCNSGTCPLTNPVDQVCGGTETDGNRYCYTGQKPKLYDSQKIYDIRGSACAANLSCPAGPPAQFCGIDNYCYRPALRTTRLGFTTSQSTQSQIITINNFSTAWQP